MSFHLKFKNLRPRELMSQQGWEVNLAIRQHLWCHGAGSHIAALAKPYSIGGESFHYEVRIFKCLQNVTQAFVLTD